MSPLPPELSRLQPDRQSTLGRALNELGRIHHALNHHAIVSITDRHGVITSVNERFCTISGYARDELIGRTHSILKSGQHEASLYRELWATITRGEVWHGVICNRRKDGGVYWVQSTIVPLTDEAGQIEAFMSVRTDITGQVQASAAKSAFLSNTSHELRTPMNAILGFAQLLALYNHDAQQQGWVKEILRAGQHLMTLIDDILDLSRIESGADVLAMQAVDMAALCRECLSLIAPLLASKRLRVQNDAATGPAWVMADPVRLKQVILNLLSNAVKYNREGGLLALHLETRPSGMPQSGHIRLCVQDQGPGLAAQQMGQLFEPFNRLGAEGRGIPGTGIGLAISKKLIDRMQGRIGASSIQGEGSTFWIELKTPVFS